MKYIIYFWITLLSFSPALAYGSGDTIYVRRGENKKPSLLDRKFVYRQMESAAPAASPVTNITAMHQQYSAPKTAVVSKTKSTARQDHGSNDWSDFAVEDSFDESRDVSAKLLL